MLTLERVLNLIEQVWEREMSDKFTGGMVLVSRETECWTISPTSSFCGPQENIQG